MLDALPCTVFWRAGTRPHQKAASEAASRPGTTKRYQGLGLWDSGMASGARRRPQGITRGASKLQADCKQPQASRRAAADVVAQQSTLAASTAIHQRFQLPHIGRAQVFTRQQGLHLFKNAMLRHGWQDGCRRTNGDTGHADGQPFRCGFKLCPTCRAAAQQPSKHADQYTGP